jgi:hypothetical protein
MRAVRPKPSPAVLVSGLTAGIPEVSRFSCMKLPGVSGVFDYAGPNRDSRYRPCPYCLPPEIKRRRPDCLFSELNTQPTCTPVYASPCISRYTAQNSGPSGSLLLSRRTLSFPASCRFIPALTSGHNRPIASHFHSGGLEFSYLGQDLDEADGEPKETIARVAVWE